MKRAHNSSAHSEIRALLLDGKRLCRHCLREVATTIDYRKPISEGGKVRLDNAIASCQSCNSSRGANVGRER
jgi:5-methylcytosine-specific restriction endonuclease McrA